VITRLALTPGEPAGIGPDLVLAAAMNPPDAQLVVVGDQQLMAQRAAALDLPLTLVPFDEFAAPRRNEAGELFVCNVALAEPAHPGRLNTANSPYVLNTLEVATSLALRKQFHALVTGPVHKGVINEAGIPFSGHTEFLAQQCEVDLTVMMLATEGLRVALATTHLPLHRVAAAITEDGLTEVLTILHRDLKHKFAIEEPRILVCGLNPHAGESGHLGTEEIDIIEPVLNRLSQQGMDLTGPLPADTLFTEKYLGKTDAVLAMYHDQGLIPFKTLSFGKGVNFTAGLNGVRTSPDHGTALDIAGKGIADASSFNEALFAAREIYLQRKEFKESN